MLSRDLCDEFVCKQKSRSENSNLQSHHQNHQLLPFSDSDSIIRYLSVVVNKSEVDVIAVDTTLDSTVEHASGADAGTSIDVTTDELVVTDVLFFGG